MIIRPKFANEHYYHIYNRGVAKQKIFHNTQDYQHFLDTLSFYLEKNPESKFSALPFKKRRKFLSANVKKPLVEILAYCLMPNHFHLIVKQLLDGGITTFMRRSLNSYTRAYNTRYNRVGTIFQGRFSAVLVENDEQLLHLSRYIHLNPFVAKITNEPKNYLWSSYNINYLRSNNSRLCKTDLIISLVGSSELYKAFVENYAGYAQDLAYIKNQLIDTR